MWGLQARQRLLPGDPLPRFDDADEIFRLNNLINERTLGLLKYFRIFGCHVYSTCNPDVSNRRVQQSGNFIASWPTWQTLCRVTNPCHVTNPCYVTASPRHWELRNSSTDVFRQHLDPSSQYHDPVLNISIPIFNISISLLLMSHSLHSVTGLVVTVEIYITRSK